ncbi:hypothetical protein [Marinobacter sp. X15-166B]|uniref:hypothetical protein n=1 Tax=Marinobacter sp. X15-166B TaxID=1897620 RepID=UPI00085CD2A1|nr:hypothetical protein [Marinobacter sp. X15-166B]OEY67447.1 hypothetical protein BG841_14075 [Marinobacter sp. X15-166B]
MGSISFTYTDSRGNTAEWVVEHWKESGRYLQGVCVVDEKYRTFRKDRIDRYLGEGEATVTQPYTPPPPKIETRPEICFTGFSKATRASLEELATRRDMLVRKSVTKSLAFLCCGPNAGPVKIQTARDQGCFILSHEALLTMLETGEIPDEY